MTRFCVLESTYDFEFESHGREISDESWLTSIDTGASTTQTGVWSSDWLDEKLYGFEPGDDFVVLDENYTGVQSLEVVEQKGVAWTDVDTTEEAVLEEIFDRDTGWRTGQGVIAV